MSHILRCQVRDLRRGVCVSDAGGGEGEVLLEPEEGCGDGGGEVGGCVDGEGDVGAVQGEGGDEGRGFGGDCGGVLDFVSLDVVAMGCADLCS